LLSRFFWSLEPFKLESDCFRRSAVGTFLMGHGNLQPFVSTYLTTWVEFSICSSNQLSCSRSSLTWLSCSKYSLGHLLVRVQYSSGSTFLSLMSLALSFFFSFSPTSAVQLEGEVRSLFEGGWSRIRGERFPASCSSCPRFRFREDTDGFGRICGLCCTCTRSGLQHGKRSNEGTYFSALEDVTCWWGGRRLYFLDVITFGCELLAKVFYRL